MHVAVFRAFALRCAYYTDSLEGFACFLFACAAEKTEGLMRPLAILLRPAMLLPRRTVMKQLSPATLPPPFARYAHGVHVPPGSGLVLTSGQLGLLPDGTVPEGAEAQAQVCFANCAAILAEAGMSPQDTVRINAFVTDRAHMAGYMAARDAFCAAMTRLPASTLVIVAGFTRPEFVVEVELTAAKG